LTAPSAGYPQYQDRAASASNPPPQNTPQIAKLRPCDAIGKRWNDHRARSPAASAQPAGQTLPNSLYPRPRIDVIGVKWLANLQKNRLAIIDFTGQFMHLHRSLSRLMNGKK
jgi:hypothetical protein